MKRAIQTKISLDDFKRPRESISASSSANVSDATPVQLTLTPALPPTPAGEDAVSEGDAASLPTAKDAGTTSDEDVNYGCLVCSSVNSIGINKEQGVSLSREWMNFEIQVSGQRSRTTSLSALRNKVRKHALSKAHTQAVNVAEQQDKAAIEQCYD
ncbi:unnamed protein product [Arctogadus glacialis]